MRITPFFAAIFFQAVVMDGWWLAILAFTLVFLQRVFQWEWKLDFGSTLAISFFSVVALLLPSGHSPSIGVLPPVFGGLLLNLVTVFGVFLASTEKYKRSYLLAWGVIGLSVQDQQTFAATLLLSLFGGSLLIVAAHDAGLLRQCRRMGVIWIIFLVLTGFASFGFASLTRVAQSAIQNVLSGYYELGPITGVSGLSEDVYIGSRGNMISSPIAVLELSRPVSRLRTKVFDRFDGIRWTASQELMRFESQEPSLAVDEFLGEQLEYVWLEKPAVGFPTPPGTIHVMNQRALRAQGWIYRLSDPPSRVELIFDPREQLPSETISLGLMLDVPADLQDELRDFGNQVVGTNDDVIFVSSQLQDYFHQNYSYSLTTQFDTNGHPVLEMLKPGTAAYCVHFASAMALTLRMQGIPTRLVTGYLPLETNGITNRTTVRRRDAHAWVEVWLDSEQKFVPFDPTPIDSRNQILGLSSSRSWGADFLDAVVSYLHRAWIFSGRKPHLFFLHLLRMVVTYLWFPILVTLLVLGIRVGRYRRRSMRQSLAIQDQDISRAYEVFLKTLRRKKVRMDANESDTVVIDRLREAGYVEASLSADKFLRSYRRMRFGGCPYEPLLLALAQEIEKDE